MKALVLLYRNLGTTRNTPNTKMKDVREHPGGVVRCGVVGGGRLEKRGTGNTYITDAKHGACGWRCSSYDTAPREALRHHPTAVGELVRSGRLVGHQLLPEGGLVGKRRWRITLCRFTQLGQKSLRLIHRVGGPHPPSNSASLVFCLRRAICTPLQVRRQTADGSATVRAVGSTLFLS